MRSMVEGPYSRKKPLHQPPAGPPPLQMQGRIVAEPLADAAEVRAHLVAAARAGVALSYGALLEHLGYSFSRPRMRQLCAMLGEIDRDAEASGEPELAVLVVRASDGLPGQGWWVAGGGSSRGYSGPWEGPEAARFTASVQAESFAFWQSSSGTEAPGAPR
ncbi:MAG TPA: ribose-phosphate pyrophosphokinase [Allosphingosinicella sp.]|nr:ribose-phosphate pyrophosphokinase [Allosphingosinicella sp.]